jgi:hypothetical protein
MFFQTPNTDQRSVLRIPITKIDRERHEVWGVAAVEEPDRAGEVLDYDTSKPHFERWSQSFVDATNGASLGNLRSMHTKIAAGKLISFKPNDALKRFEVGAKVIDENEWKKCEEGVYTGFSIGGDYVGQKWEDPVHKGFKRYTGAPAELSLVDAPCIPGATFEVVKAGGGTELRKFACIRTDELAKSLASKMVKAGIETLNDSELDELLVKASGQKTKAVAGKELTAKDFAFVGDPTKPDTWSLPTPDAAHAQNAMARFNQTEGIPPEKKHVVAQHIIAAARKHGVEAKTFAQKAVMDCFPNALAKRGIVVDADRAPLAKSMWDVGRLADILCSLAWMESSLRDEAIYEDDDSKIPAALLSALQPLKQIFIDLATEEVGELIRDSQAGDEDDALELGTFGIFDLAKFNENHGEDGKFSEALSGAGFESTGTGKYRPSVGHPLYTPTSRVKVSYLGAHPKNSGASWEHRGQQIPSGPVGQITRGSGVRSLSDHLKSLGFGSAKKIASDEGALELSAIGSIFALAKAS